MILSDHGMPSFDGLTALSVAREKRPDVPFIFVTNALSKEMEIEKLTDDELDALQAKFERIRAASLERMERKKRNGKAE